MPNGRHDGTSVIVARKYLDDTEIRAIEEGNEDNPYTTRLDACCEWMKVDPNAKRSFLRESCYKANFGASADCQCLVQSGHIKRASGGLDQKRVSMPECSSNRFLHSDYNP